VHYAPRTGSCLLLAYGMSAVSCNEACLELLGATLFFCGSSLFRYASYKNKKNTMADIVAFHAALARCGFNADTAEEITNQGFD